ncbi:hypothetical protein F5882DRAFT_439521 [Hyaloscypha sp. PMI_1271]|nr:hypothetical protein F5882DRAFT_439521 [Hyaloscypha sp. PMI_1271]
MLTCVGNGAASHHIDRRFQGPVKLPSPLRCAEPVNYESRRILVQPVGAQQTSLDALGFGDPGGLIRGMEMQDFRLCHHRGSCWPESGVRVKVKVRESLMCGWVNIRILLPQRPPYFRWRPRNPRPAPPPTIAEPTHYSAAASKFGRSQIEPPSRRRGEMRTRCGRQRAPSAPSREGYRSSSTSHVARRICTQSVQPRVLPRRKKTRAAARARRHLAPLAPEQRSLARLRMRALPQANAHYGVLHQATRRPRATDEGGTLPWPFWKEWLEEESAVQTARWAGEGKEPVTGRTRLTRLTVPHMAAPLSQTAYRSPQGFSPNHRAPIVFWWPFWLLEDALPGEAVAVLMTSSSCAPRDYSGGNEPASGQDSPLPLLSHRPRGGTGAGGTSMEDSHTEFLAATCFRAMEHQWKVNPKSPSPSPRSKHLSIAGNVSVLLRSICSTSYGQRAGMEGGHLAALRLPPLHPYEATTTSSPRRFVISSIRSAFLWVYIRARSAAVRDS